MLRQDISLLKQIQALDVYRAMRHVNEGESESLSEAGRKQVEPLILAVRKRAAQERAEQAKKAAEARRPKTAVGKSQRKPRQA